MSAHRILYKQQNQPTKQANYSLSSVLSLHSASLKESKVITPHRPCPVDAGSPWESSTTLDGAVSSEYHAP